MNNALNPKAGNAASSREIIYARLEEKFLTYRDLKSIPVADNGEPLIDLGTRGIPVCIYDAEIRASSGDKIFVRSSVADRLLQAQGRLQQTYPDYRLQVFYGYRSPSVQVEKFEKISRQFGFNAPLTDDQLEIIHRSIAVPDVAGHPTGGAVDVTLVDAEGKTLDMGTPPHAFIKDSYTFSPFISRAVWANRQILRNAMLAADFAPFDGEWWHFSYGDREWAKYYQRKESLYGPV